MSDIFPPIVLELKAKADELRAELGKVKGEVAHMAKEAEKSGGTVNKSFQTMAGAGKAITFGLAGAAVAVGGFAMEAGMAGEKVDAQLAQAIKNAGGNMEELDPKIKAVDSTMRGFGFTNDDTNAALTRLTVATKDPAKALDAVSVAADLARSRNIPLATATDLVAKAMAGQTGALTRMGINLPIAAGGAQKLVSAQQALQKAQDGVNAVLQKYPDAANPASKAHAQYEAATKKVADAQAKLQQVQAAGGDVLKALESRVKGAASAYGDTLAGKMAAAKAQVENIGEALGQRLIPIVTSALGAASKFIGWLNDHTPVLYTLAAVIGTVVVTAVGAYIATQVKAAAQTIKSFAEMIGKAAVWAATKLGLYTEVSAASEASATAQVAAQEEVSAAEEAGAAVAEEAGAAQAMAFGPIGIAVMAIIVVITLLVTHWKQVWGVIKTVFGAVWDFLKGAWNWIKTIFIEAFQMELHALEAVWHAVWGAVKAAFSAVWDFLKDAWNWIKSIFIDYFKIQILIWKTVWDAVWNGAKATLQAIWDFLKDAWNWIKSIFIDAFQTALHGLESVFSSVWGGIKSVVSGVWGFLQGVWGGIQSGVHAVWSVIQSLGSIFSSVFNGIKSVVSDVWNFLKGIFDAISGAISKVVGAVGGVIHTIGSVGSSIGHFLGFDNGGVVPGPKGAPRLAVVHGGEYVLSTDMLAGKQEPTGLTDAQSANGYTAMGGGSSAAALSGSGSAPAVTGGAPQVTVNVATNASPAAIASQIGWTLRAMA